MSTLSLPIGAVLKNDGVIAVELTEWLKSAPAACELYDADWCSRDTPAAPCEKCAEGYQCVQAADNAVLPDGSTDNPHNYSGHGYLIGWYESNLPAGSKIEFYFYGEKMEV